jgi:AcrR family transcriptional regulator
MQNNLLRTKIAAPGSAKTGTNSRKKPRRRTQEERSATTRRRLIDAAVECLSDLGYLEATVEVVAERAGVSRGAVQHHFGSRDDLLIAVVYDFGLALAGLDTIASDLTVVERVNAAVDRSWELVRSPHFIAVVQIWLATRHIPEVLKITSKKIALFEREMDRQWQNFFSELPAPPAKIAVVRHIVLAALRGLALRTLYRKGRASWTEEIAMLKSMVITALS